MFVSIRNSQFKNNNLNNSIDLSNRNLHSAQEYAKQIYRTEATDWRDKNPPCNWVMAFSQCRFDIDPLNFSHYANIINRRCWQWKGSSCKVRGVTWYRNASTSSRMNHTPARFPVSCRTLSRTCSHQGNSHCETPFEWGIFFGCTQVRLFSLCHVYF